MREIRDYQPGDPLKRVAWKASAKRGRLLVRQTEHEEREVVWVIVDASVELWAGPLGRAPLDTSLDAAATVIQTHLACGDMVGLAVVAQRVLAEEKPAHGKTHEKRLINLLSFACACHDADRSSDAEEDVALAVYEQLWSLDPASMRGVGVRDFDRLLRRCAAHIDRAPFRDVHVVAPTRREETLRKFRAAFGMYAPARSEPERRATWLTLNTWLEQHCSSKPHATVLHLIGQLPSGDHPLLSTLLRLHRRRVDVRVTLPDFEGSIVANPIVARWVSSRVQLHRRRFERDLRMRGLRTLGV